MSLISAQEISRMRIEQICRNVDTQQASLIKLSDFIWKNPEDSLREVKAAVALSDYLRGNGARHSDRRIEIGGLVRVD